MTDPIGLTMAQTPARNLAEKPFQALSENALKQLDAMKPAYETKIDGMFNTGKDGNIAGLEPESAHASPAMEHAKMFVRQAELMKEISTQMMHFKVGLGVTQSFGRHMQQFLRGQ